MNTPQNYDYNALDDIGFIGDQAYKWTDEDTVFVRQCFAEHKRMNAKNSVNRPQSREPVYALRSML